MTMRRFFFALLLTLSACGESSGTDTGPGPSDTPGSPCTAYCNAIALACTGANAQYMSPAACTTACAGFPMGMPGDMSGNSLGCRTYHASAAVADPATHCSHAGPTGGGVCN